MFLEGQERKYSMMHYAMLMLQLEVNISSSQGFSLVNQTSPPNISAKPLLLLLIIIILLSQFHMDFLSFTVVL